uniref:transposase n=1 Tax=Lactobacillus delbrueckii TaxID=1584 RepID=UPI0035BF875C
MYMQQKSGKCTSGFSKNTYYRFMQNPHINWLRFIILLAERIVNGHLKDLTSDQRADCFVFDDSLYSRTGYKKTELAAKDGAQIDARIVCVRNRSNRKDWIALICTDMTIDENEIIRIYGKRWDIEVFFKACKSFLKLGTEYHGLSHDALTAHTAFVFLRYMFMSVEKRDDEDDRTIGELFYCMVDELADITFNHSLQILVGAMFESMKEIFQPTEEQMVRFTNAFISRLPKYMQEAISPSLAA